jgi:Protein of unknown function (DUF1549)/Protein of unknown function (DUF1553)/Planctomycete cytochrome C
MIPRSRALALTLLLFVGVASSQSAPTPSPTDPAKIEFFEKKVRTILVDHCYHCHSADTKPAGGLRVDDRVGLMIGGNKGPAVVPGEPAKSPLIARVTQKNEKGRMPLEGKHLTDEEVDVLRQWIKDGAAWPAVHIPSSLGKVKPEYEKLKKEHWAFQPIAKPAVPAVKDSSWAQSDADRFILAGLEAKGLKPVGAADKATLLRRITFDLTGLPATAAEIADFLKDDSAQAFEKVVDRLLASPRYGEHWGRHWLDVARYGESTGPSRNIPYPHAWRYRDYVIDAVNADIPFDRFIREQIAGDLLEAKTDKERDRQLTATGFLALGVKDVNQRFKVRFLMDNIDEQIDAVSRSVLGLTVSCARCHDHKFDPVPMADYYAIAGIFTSTENAAGVRNLMGGGGLAYYVPANLVKLTSAKPPADPEKVAKLKAQVEEAKKAWDSIRGTPQGVKKDEKTGQPTQRPFRLKYEALQAELDSLSDPAASGHAVHGVREGQVIADTEIRIRGEAEKLGPVVPRGFLTAFEVAGAPKVNPKQSGRLELAQWLSSPNNPLTARVAANRVWQRLFGTGIVNTVDNFGVTGGTPSNPELLDYVANRYIAAGWSTKKLIRELVLTRAYQLGSEATEAHRVADPENRLIWRHCPRRLSAEEMRDAALTAAGTLDLKRPEGSPANALRMVEMRDNGPEAKNINDKADTASCRSVYLPLLRGVIPHALEAFDPVDQTLVSGTRDATTVPAQSLFLLNSTFVRQQALNFADRLLKANDASESERVHLAYRLALGREPTEKEVERAMGFVGEYESAWRAHPPKVAKPTPKKSPEPKKKAATDNPDEVDQTGEIVDETSVQAKDPKTAAWMALTQALIASTEFRYVK